METYSFSNSHSQLLTMEYAIREVRALLRDILTGSYPSHETLGKTLNGAKMNWRELKVLVRELYKTIPAVSGTEEENLYFLHHEARKVFPGDNPGIIPMMMEVYHRYSSNLRGRDAIGSKYCEAVDVKLFQNCWNEILDDFRSYLHSQNVVLDLSDMIVKSSNLEKTLHLIEKERSVKDSLMVRQEKRLHSDSVAVPHSVRIVPGGRDYPFKSDYFLG